MPMLYPPQLSFIPITVALARFVEAGGSVWENYPYWYLGSTPFRYLTGPIVPFLLVGMHKVLPQFSLFDLALLLVVSCQLLFSFGWGFLAGRLSNRRRIGVLVGVISLFAPWHIVSALALGEVSAVLASALTPWVLLAFAWSSVYSLKKRSTKLGYGFNPQMSVSLKPPLATTREMKSNLNFRARFVMFLRKFPSLPLVSNVKCQLSIVNCLLPAAAFGLLLLINATAAIPAVVGLLILGIVLSKHWEEGLKRVALVVVFGWAMTLWWFTPGYWWTIFGAPSIGGKIAVSAFVNMLNLLRGFVPVILALLLVFWKVNPRTVFEKFILSWIVIFGSLTLFRFVADFDFWMDWTSWMGEVEVGLALVIAGNFQFKIFNFHSIFNVLKFKFKTSFQISNWFRFLAKSKFQINKMTIFLGPQFMRTASFAYFLFSIYFVFGWFYAWQNRDFWLPRKNIENTVEYRIAKWLEQNVNCQLSIVNCPTVFLSGTMAFWLNSLVDVVQVRGGADQASVHPTWRQAAWEIREGATTEGTERVLKALKINYVVVHTDESDEFYHDFKDVEKFEQSTSLKKVYENRGDVIYKIE